MVGHSSSQARAHARVIRLLQTREDEYRDWAGGDVRIALKARILKRLVPSCVAFDYSCMEAETSTFGSRATNGRSILNALVLTDDDESNSVWRRSMAAARRRRYPILIRSGKFDPPNAKGMIPIIPLC